MEMLPGSMEKKRRGWELLVGEYAVESEVLRDILNWEDAYSRFEQSSEGGEVSRDLGEWASQAEGNMQRSLGDSLPEVLKGQSVAAGAEGQS